MYKMTASNFSQNEAREVFYKLKNNSLRNIKNILKNIHIGMRLEGLRRVDVPEIDKEAFREAIINAFCHRDYYEYDSVNIAVFKDKKGGLVVDYLGIADELKKALSDYTESGGRGKTVFDKEEAVALMLEKYELVAELFHGFDYERFFTAPPREKMCIIPAAMEHVIKQENGKERYLEYVTRLSQAFALAVPHEEALKIRDGVGFFQVIRSGLAKTTVIAGKPQEELDSAIRQIISKAIVSDKVIDIFDAVGLKKPDISILSDEFLAEVKRMPHKNLAFELLRKLLNDEIKTRSKKNLIQGKSFAEMLEKAIKRYQNKSIETAQVIEELIELAKEMREARLRGEKLNLNEEELAFYDALEVNDSAVKVLGNEKLTIIQLVPIIVPRSEKLNIFRFSCRSNQPHI
jgi:type I restriction enzyme R subunit